MKDKKWLKEEIESKFHRWYDSDQTLNSLIANINNLIDQLDEPEVLSQEWIDKHKYRYDNIEVVGIKDLQNLLVPKQELPVIPKYVAGYLEKAKADINLMRVMDIAYNYGEIDKFNKHYDWIRENHELFARAWLDGYKIEEEQLFYALVKGHELCSDLFKYWNCKAYNSGHLLVGSKYPKASCINRMTKANWNKIGINESNADFVKAEEVE